MDNYLENSFNALSYLSNIIDSVEFGELKNQVVTTEVATEGALKNREQNLARIQAKQEKLHQEALAKVAEIEKLGQLELSAKAGESGKLFGTITTKKLCEELKEKANIEVDRKTVSLSSPINKVGEFTMLIKLTSKVKTELKIVVTASEVVKESIEETVEEVVES